MIKDYCKFIWSFFAGLGLCLIILLIYTLFLSAAIVPGVVCDHARQTGQSIFYFYGIAGGVLCLLSALTVMFLINWAEKSGKDFFPKTTCPPPRPPCSQGKATHVNCPGCGAARNGNQCDYCGMTTESMLVIQEDNSGLTSRGHVV